jgi:hypothetical protein
LIAKWIFKQKIKRRIDMDILSQYWGIIVFLVGATMYVLTHKKIAKSYAKKKIASLMLSAEKGAEKLILENGQEKFDWVVDKGYDLMPSAVRVFIGKPLFKIIAQKLYDDAKVFIELHKKDIPVVPATDSLTKLP